MAKFCIAFEFKAEKNFKSESNVVRSRLSDWIGENAIQIFSNDLPPVEVSIYKSVIIHHTWSGNNCNGYNSFSYSFESWEDFPPEVKELLDSIPARFKSAEM